MGGRFSRCFRPSQTMVLDNYTHQYEHTTQDSISVPVVAICPEDDSFENPSFVGKVYTDV